MGKKNEPATAAPASAESPKPAIKPAPAITGSVESLGAKPAATALPTGNGHAAPKKAAVKKKPAKAAAKKKPVTFSAEDIALRAYYISEHRQRHGLHGDEQGDWIEAERQLRAELRKKAVKKPATSKQRD